MSSTSTPTLVIVPGWRDSGPGHWQSLWSDAVSGAVRVLIRESGTEPLVRVMAEGEDEALVAQVVDDLCGVIARAAAA